MDLPFERVVYETSEEDFDSHSTEAYSSADDLAAVAQYHLVGEKKKKRERVFIECISYSSFHRASLRKS